LVCAAGIISGAVESSFTEQVVKEMLNMARAAKRFAENYNPSQFEVKFEYGFGSDDMLVIGIADALGENLVLDWKTGSFMAESHRQQVKIYATMLWRLGLLQLPATLGVVYLAKLVWKAHRLSQMCFNLPRRKPWWWRILFSNF